MLHDLTDTVSHTTETAKTAAALSERRPDRPSIIRLVGAVLAEQHDEWAEGRRYLGLDVVTRAQAVATDYRKKAAVPAITV